MKNKTILLFGFLGILIGYATLTKTGRENIMSSIRQISQKGIDLLKSLEGFSSKAYWDVKGWSIGFGHFMGATKLEDNISLERGIELLKQDLQWVTDTINNYVKVPLNQNQFDALTSFIYNVGKGAFINSTLLKKLNAGDYLGAYNEFPKWRMAGGQVNQGLVDRREQERRLFMS